MSGLRFFVDYDIPNYYCLDSGDWPPGYTCFNDITSGFHTSSLTLVKEPNTVVKTAWAYYENGSWDTGTDLTSCGTYHVTVTMLTTTGPVQTNSPPIVLTPPGIPCPAPDRGSCPVGGGGQGASTGVAMPINVGSGDVTTTIPLFTIQQSPKPLVFNLTYHSSPLTYASVSVPEPLGKGWTHPFNQALKPIPATNRLYHYTADGREFEYTQNGSAWTASRPAEARGTVTLVSDEYRLTDLDGTVTAFDQATGRWKRTNDRWGNSIQGAPVGSNPTTITDSAGRLLTLTYSSGVLQSISIPDGSEARAWSFNYNAGNTLLVGIRDPLHPSTNWRSLAYDGGNRLVSITDDAPKMLEGHTYDAQGRGWTSYSEGGNRNFVQVEYDQPSIGQRRVTHRIDATTNQVSVFSLAYQGGRWLPTLIVGPCSTCTGAGGDTQSFVYTSDNHVDTVTDGRGNVTKFVYNADGNVTSMTEASGTGLARTTTWFYVYSPWPNFWTTLSVPSTDGAHTKTTTRGWGTGEATLTITETGYTAGSQVSYITTESYDYKHRLRSVNGPRTDVSDLTTYAYYADSDLNNNTGRLSSITDAVSLQTTFADYDVFGTAKTTTDPNGARTLLTTDWRGRVLTRTLKAISGDPESADYVTTYAYDGRDRLTSTTFPRGNSTAYVYDDGTNRLTATIRRDSSGNQQERLLYTLNDIGGRVEEDSQVCGTPLPACTAWATRRTEKFVYDTKNRLWQILHPVPLPADSTKIIYTYDANGLLATVQDERHSSSNTTYTYDALNRFWQVIQTLAGAPGNQIQTVYGYDVQDNLTSVTDPNGSLTTYTFDDFRRMTRQVSPVSGTTNYSYDQAGNLSSSTDANSPPATTARTYDAANRPWTATSTRTGFPTEVVTNTYDDAPSTYGKGRLKSSSVTRGGSATISTAYTYDRRGLVRSEAHTLLGYGYSLSYGYDGNGNRTRITYPSTRVVNYTFDFADRPLTAAASGGATYVSSATYEPFGPEKTLVFGTSNTRTAGWNTRYQPLSLTLTGGSEVAVNDTYSLDPLGNITAITDNNNAAYNRTLGYDDLNRLTSATTGAGLWGATGSFVYGGTFGSVRDNLNRRQLLFGTRNVTYVYQSVTGHWTTMLTSQFDPSQTTVGRDAVGNETSFGSVTSTYTTRNSLAGTGATTYLHDGRGVRMAEQIQSGGTQNRFFFYSPELSLLSETNLTTGTPATQYEYIWFGGRPVAQEKVGDPTALRYTMTDHLGTPFLQTNSAGSVTWRVEHEPFGNIYAFRNGTSSDWQPLRFPGQEERSSSPGRFYNVFRWYRPDVGAYTQVDPAGLAAGTNLFSYVLGNPVGASDSLGLLGSIFGGIQRGFACAVPIAKSAAAEGPTNGWPWAHCMASCEIRKQCGFATAWNLALLKEFWDVAQCGLELFGGRRPPVGGSCFSAFQAGDFENNAFGRRCPKDNDCSRHCSPLLFQFDRPEDAGPLYDWARHAAPGRGWQP
jgi:RHS repeat-associated protein